MALSSCGEGAPSVVCGAGTEQVGNTCLPADAGSVPSLDGGGSDAGALADAGPADAGLLDAGVSEDAGAPDAGTPDAGPVDAGVVDPGLPSFPATIGTLSVALRTGNGADDGTDANEISLCLNEARCFPLNVADVNDFRVGELDVYHFEGISLARSAVNRVELRSRNGTDRFKPTCLQIQFDGEPVYCNDTLNVALGNDVSEVQSWSDPAGLGRRCESCYPEPITHGPILGAVGPNTAKILVRTDATRRVGLHVIDQARPEASPAVAYAYPTPGRDYTTVFDVAGLRPNTPYAYFFRVGERLVPGLRTFTTAPPLDAATVFRVAFGSCTRLESQPIFRQIESARPDLFLFVGDNHYGNTPDLGSLRWNYRWALERPERAQMMTGIPTLAVWDDHDFVGNNTLGSAPGRASALRAFTEYWPNPSFGAPTVPGVFFNHVYGDVEFFMLDDRYYRGIGPTLLGAEQEAWLKTQLLASRATFKVLVTGSQWTADGSSDSWAAFLSARNALFDFIKTRNIGGVVLLSGDVHRSELRSIARTGTYALPEITSSPMANTNFACPSDTELRACFDTGNYFVTLDFDTIRADPRLRATIWDERGLSKAVWDITRGTLGPR